MSTFLQRALLGSGLVLVLATAAAGAAVANSPPPQNVGFRVSVDASGKVQSVQPTDPQAVLNGAAEGFARKLVLAPARKHGVAVASETNLTLTLALEKREDGRFGVQLKRAYNGPGVQRVGALAQTGYPKGREGGALVVVAVNVNADGSPDMGTMSTERMELRVPSQISESRFLGAVTGSVRGTRFELDKVGGVVVPARVTLPYVFGGGPAKSASDEERKGKPKGLDMISMPAMQAVSNLPGIELAKIDYHAPVAATTPPTIPPAK